MQTTTDRATEAIKRSDVSGVMPGALHGPLIVLLEEDGADAVAEWRIRWDQMPTTSAPLDLARGGVYETRSR